MPIIDHSPTLAGLFQRNVPTSKLVSKYTNQRLGTPGQPQHDKMPRDIDIYAGTFSVEDISILPALQVLTLLTRNFFPNGVKRMLGRSPLHKC